MSNWLVLSLGAAFCWSIVNILDKLIVVEYIKFHWSRLILDSLVGLTVCFFLFAFNRVDIQNSKGLVVLLSMLAGVLLYGFNYMYYKALEAAEVSTVTALLQVVPIFSALWGFLFFQEKFGLFIYIGIILIVSGAVFVNIEEKGKGKVTLIKGRNWRSATLYLLPGIFILSINYALQKYILNFSDPQTIFFWARIGAFVFTTLVILFSSQIRKGFLGTVNKLQRISFLLIAVIEWVNLAGIYLLLEAYSVGSVTLVTTVSAVQPLLVLILSIVITMVIKKPILSDYSRFTKTVLIRCVSLVLIIVGTFFISS